MDNLDDALKAWRNLLGSENVLSDSDACEAAQTATFATAQQVPAIIRPSNRVDVQACVKIANQYRIPISPVSRGKNWGYGSRVPTKNNTVLMELARLNNIIDYNEKLAYVTVEAGVTQQQLFTYLEDNKSNLFMSVTGGPPDSSLVGNTLERGIGKGPYGDKFNHVCGFEVVLPTGECIHTGFERFSGAKAAKVNRWGVGPYFDGLFTQSNLGIVTKMTLWLLPIPKYVQTFFYSINDDSQLEPLIDTLQSLKLAGLIRGTFVIANDYRTLSFEQLFPWDQADGKKPLPTHLMDKLRKKLGGGVWFGEGALYSMSKQQGKAEKKIIKKALNKTVNKLTFFDAQFAKIVPFFYPLYQWITGIELDNASLNFLYKNSPHRGVPMKQSIAMTYWKKRTAIPEDMNPDRDHCGLIWCVPAVPFDGQHVRKALNIIEQTAKVHQFDLNVGLNCLTERCLDITVSIVYDRKIKGEDKRAMAYHDLMFQKLVEAGYIPYRLGINAMNSLPSPHDDYAKLVQNIKQTLDPNDILSPGRYDFRKDWDKD